MNEIIIFKLGKESYALNIEHVIEIMKTKEINKSVITNKYTKGIVDIRDKVSTVVDIFKILGIEGEENYFIICKGDNDSQLVIPITDIVTIHNLEKEELLPRTYDAFVTDLVEGIIKHKEELTFILDFDKILDILNDE